MKRIQTRFGRISLAMALSATGAVVGATGISMLLPIDAAHAMVQKKDKKQKAPKYDISNEFAQSFDAGQKLMEAGDIAGAKQAAEALIATASTPDEKFLTGNLLLNAGIQLSDQSVQKTALKLLIESGKTPAEQIGTYNFYVGSFAYEEKNYPEARQYMKQAIDAGFLKNNVGAVYAEAFFNDNRPEEGLVALEQMIGLYNSNNIEVPESWYRRGAGKALEIKNTALLDKWTKKMIVAYPSAENWRTALTIFRENSSYESAVNLDLMRLMRAADALESERDYYEYVENANPGFLPGEVADVIREGEAKGALTVNDNVFADNLRMANSSIAEDKKSLSGAERDARSSANGRIAMGTADAYLSYKEYGKAIDLYNVALGKSNVDADAANMRIAIAQYLQGDAETAHMQMGKVGGVRQPLAEYWQLWIEQQAVSSTSETATSAVETASDPADPAG